MTHFGNQSIQVHLELIEFSADFFVRFFPQIEMYIFRSANFSLGVFVTVHKAFFVVTTYYYYCCFCCRLIPSPLLSTRRSEKTPPLK